MKSSTGASLGPSSTIPSEIGHLLSVSSQKVVDDEFRIKPLQLDALYRELKWRGAISQARVNDTMLEKSVDCLILGG